MINDLIYSIAKYKMLTNVITYISIAFIYKIIAYAHSEKKPK